MMFMAVIVINHAQTIVPNQYVRQMEPVSTVDLDGKENSVETVRKNNNLISIRFMNFF